MCVPPSHLVPHLQKWVIVNVIKLWWIEQEPACLSFAAKQRPKPTATGETWQSCRLGKERVLSQLLMIMVVAGVQTDTAELVCTVRGHRSIHAHREKRDQGGGTPLLLPKTERTTLDDIAPSFLYTGCWLDVEVTKCCSLLLRLAQASDPGTRLFQPFYIMD